MTFKIVVMYGRYRCLDIGLGFRDMPHLFDFYFLDNNGACYKQRFLDTNNLFTSLFYFFAVVFPPKMNRKEPADRRMFFHCRYSDALKWDVISVSRNYFVFEES